MLPKECVWGLAAHHPKANKKARLVERKVCFISDARNWGWGTCRRLFKDPLPPHQQPVGRGLL